MEITEFLPCLSCWSDHNQVSRVSKNLCPPLSLIFPLLYLSGLPEVRGDLLVEAAAEGLPGGGDPEAE